MIVPGFVDLCENPVVDLAGQIEPPDVGTESRSCRKHLDAARAALGHRSLPTSFTLCGVCKNRKTDQVCSCAACNGWQSQKCRELLGCFEPRKSHDAAGVALPIACAADNGGGDDVPHLLLVRRERHELGADLVVDPTQHCGCVWIEGVSRQHVRYALVFGRTQSQSLFMSHSRVWPGG